jgi:TolB protein
MKIPQPWHHLLLALGAITCISASSFAAEGDSITIVRPFDSLGFRNAIPVNISGFTGEAEAVLKQDLMFMGYKNVPAAEAKYLISGSNAGRIEGRVIEKINNNPLLGKAYTGGSQRSLIHALADDIARAIMPNETPIAQTKIAFKAMSGSGKAEIYVSDYDGFGAQAVTRDNSLVAAPCWAGKGALLYTTYKLGNPYIYAQQLNTGARVAVAKFPGANISPAVSPNGKRVAMILSKNGSPDLYVANLDGSGLKQLSFSKAAESSPCWSPDGETICFVSQIDGPPLLYTVSASGGAPKRLRTVNAATATEPDWSPDGKWIAFTMMSRPFQVCVVRATGGDAMALGQGEDPSWAPNSRALIVSRGSGNRHLSLLDVPSKQFKDIGRILGSDSQPSWAR